MKTINITFFTWARCTKEIEVNDDYQFPSSNPVEFWEDILENYPEYEDSDIFSDGLEDIDDFDVEQMGLDYFDSITIQDHEGIVILEKTFEKIRYS